MADVDPTQEFQDLYRADRAAGRIRSLADYQALWPGHESLIAREHSRVSASDETVRVGRETRKQATDWRPGDRLAQYQIEDELGRGGQGAVYLATDTRLHRRVALKLLSSTAAPGSETVRRFQREAEVASRLDHAGICTVYDSGVVGETPYIAMRYVRGETLARRIQSLRTGTATDSTYVDLGVTHRTAREATAVRRVDQATVPIRPDLLAAIELVEKAARALHAAHEAGVIHRDIKPGNIMVGEDGNPVVLDFGLARDLWADDVGLTQAGDLFGTPAYMSPEQVAATGVLDRRTDVYSLGATLYECVTLRPPFEAPTRAALWQRILRDEPADPRVLNLSISRDLGVVIATALSKDRDRRYQSALAFAEDLHRVRNHEPILAKPATALSRAVSWSRRNPSLATALVAIFVILGAALIVSQSLLHATERERDRADENARTRAVALADYERLADGKRLADLAREAADLFPAMPEMTARLEDWLRRARQLASNLEAHRVALANLRAGANERPASAPADTRAKRTEWRFSRTEDQWKHDYLTGLVDDLARLSDPDPAIGLIADVDARLQTSRTVTERTVGRFAAQWNEAVASIGDAAACPKYGGLRIRPQLGLVPIRRDPDSGLWEFIHVATVAPGHGPQPKVGPDGRYALVPEDGVVLVLVPGGTFAMGAARPDDAQTSGEPNVDAAAVADESPVNRVTLAPFFISKYEMTQGQWLRATGRNPASYAAGLRAGGTVFTLTHPVESIGHADAIRVSWQLGLTVPTEAQWEYAARAGTATPWWSGPDRESLRQHGVAANLADQAALRGGAQWPAIGDWPELDDGFVLHAPVGSTRANPFGLHEVHGNVFEMTREPYAQYKELAASGPEGLRAGDQSDGFIARGGSFTFNANYARVSFRYGLAPNYHNDDLGVRPARRLD